METYTRSMLKHSLQTFLYYMFPSNQLLANFDGRGIRRSRLWRANLRKYFARQESGQQIFLYSDGVGDLFTYVDIMKAFRDRSIPLYEQVYDFAIRLMHAQAYGRKIDVGVGNEIKIRGKYDNYSLWAIRMK